MILAVLDTNVIVSALILRGPVNRLVSLWRAKKFQLVVSKATMEEYLRVLAYPKFGLSTEEIKTLAASEIFPFIVPVKVHEIPSIITKDPADNIFLACAKAGRCPYLVSGDQHLLSLKKFEKTSILTITAFLNLFTQQ